MCDPVSIGIATAALSIGQAVVSYEGQRQDYNANATAANYNYARDINTNNQQQVTLDKEASQKALDTSITSLRAQGDIVSSASERGLGSQSIAQSLNAAMFGLGRQQDIEAQNDNTQRMNVANSRVDAGIRRQSQINSKSKPGAVSLALGIGSGVLSGFNAYNGAKKAG